LKQIIAAIRAHKIENDFL